MGCYVLIGLLLLGLAWLQFRWRRRYANLRFELAAQHHSCSAYRVQHDQLYAEQQAQMQALFDSMAEGVLVLDSSSRVQLVNQSLQHLFGLTADVKGQTILEAFRLHELAGLVKRLADERMVRNFEMEMPGLAERWVQINAAALLDPGATPGAPSWCSMT